MKHSSLANIHGCYENAVRTGHDPATGSSYSWALAAVAIGFGLLTSVWARSCWGGDSQDATGASILAVRTNESIVVNGELENTFGGPPPR